MLYCQSNDSVWASPASAAANNNSYHVAFTRNSAVSDKLHDACKCNGVATPRNKTQNLEVSVNSCWHK